MRFLRAYLFVVIGLSILVQNSYGSDHAAIQGRVVAAELTYDGGRFSPCLSLDFLKDAGEILGLDLAAYTVPVALESGAIMDYPLVMMTGDLPFSLSDAERMRLAEYLMSGDGFLVAFPGCANPFWRESFRLEFATFATALELRPLSSTDRLQSFFRDIPDAIGAAGEEEEEQMNFMGIWAGDRLAGIFVELGLNASDRVKGCCCCQDEDWEYGHDFLVNVVWSVLSERPEQFMMVEGEGGNGIPKFLSTSDSADLLQGLSDDDWRVRAWALRLAVRQGLPRNATEIVVSLAASDPVVLVRRLAVEYLGQRFERDSVGVLTQCFERDIALRPYLVAALSRLDPNGVQELIDELDEDVVTAPLLAALRVFPMMATNQALAVLDATERQTRLTAHFMAGLSVGTDPETDQRVAEAVENAEQDALLWLLRGLAENMTLPYCDSRELRQALNERADADDDANTVTKVLLGNVSTRLGSMLADDEMDAEARDEGELGGTDEDEAVAVILFSSYGCRLCQQARALLKECIDETAASVTLIEQQIRRAESARLNEALCRHFRVAESDRLRTPMVFAPAGVLMPRQITRAAIKELLTDPRTREADADWFESLDLAAADDSLTRRFDGFGFSVVLVAGLLDSVNPCAFATLIFLVSYLHIARRTRREMIQVCLAFVTGVFVAYFLIGLGAASVLSRLQALQPVADAIRYVAAFLALIIMILSLRDGILCLRGRMVEMTLQLPDAYKARIHKVIRRGTKMRHFVAGAFVVGLVVSLLELACTGQVYAPTIVYMMNSGRMKDALGYLIVYNLAFVLPLLVILLLTCWGVGSEQLTRWLKRHAATVKFATSALFFILVLVLLWGHRLGG